MQICLPKTVRIMFSHKRITIRTCVHLCEAILLKNKLIKNNVTPVTGRLPSQRVNNAELWYLLLEKMLKKTFDSPVVWDVMTFAWPHCKTYRCSCQVALSTLPAVTDNLCLINTVRHAMSIWLGIGVSQGLSKACHAKGTEWFKCKWDFIIEKISVYRVKFS